MGLDIVYWTIKYNKMDCALFLSSFIFLWKPQRTKVNGTRIQFCIKTRGILFHIVSFVLFLTHFLENEIIFARQMSCVSSVSNKYFRTKCFQFGRNLSDAQGNDFIYTIHVLLILIWRINCELCVVVSFCWCSNTEYTDEGHSHD